jgi:hypothetical protein
MRAVRGALQALAAQAGSSDFDLLQPKGWLARATGKGKERPPVSSRSTTARAGRRRPARRREARCSGAGRPGRRVERTLLEFDVELKALEKIIDQGARWLQDMRNQLKTREAQGGDDAPRKAMQEDERRCELLVDRLKQLRAASSARAAGAGTLPGRRPAPRRVAERCSRRWTASGDVAAAAEPPSPGSEGRVAAAAKAWTRAQGATRIADAPAGRRGLRALQAQEQALAAELAALQSPCRPPPEAAPSCRCSPSTSATPG